MPNVTFWSRSFRSLRALQTAVKSWRQLQRFSSPSLLLQTLRKPSEILCHSNSILAIGLTTIKLRDQQRQFYLSNGGAVLPQYSFNQFGRWFNFQVCPFHSIATIVTSYFFIGCPLQLVAILYRHPLSGLTFLNFHIFVIGVLKSFFVKGEDNFIRARSAQGITQNTTENNSGDCTTQGQCTLGTGPTSSQVSSRFTIL